MAVSKKYTRDQLFEFYCVVKPGDILEFPRGWYSHFGVYIGQYKGINHCVVHLTVSGNEANYRLFNISASLKELDDTYGKQRAIQAGYLVDKMLGDSHGEIRIDSVEEVMLLGGEVFINNTKDKKIKPQKHVAERAVKAYENRHNEPPYNLRANNCEHFVNDRRYDRHESDQVDTVETALTIGAIVVGGAALLGAAHYLFGGSDDNREKEKRRRN